MVTAKEKFYVNENVTDFLKNLKCSFCTTRCNIFLLEQENKGVLIANGCVFCCKRRILQISEYLLPEKNVGADDISNGF